jgi:hypothetical protein
MRIALSRGMLGTLAAMPLLIAAACGYSPNFESGTLQCGSSNSCPEGYSCRSGTCWKDGAGGAGGSGGTTGTAGAGGSGGSGGRGGTGGTGGTGGGNVANFIGRWVFDGANSKRTRQCTDGTNETLMPWNDFVTVEAGTVSPLGIGYYCLWNADVNGNSTVIRPGQSCQDLIMLPGTTFTYRAESFTLTTTNGSTGTLDASIPYDYMNATSSGSCTMKFTGPVTKN